MPYIKPVYRVKLDDKLAELTQLIDNEGELNYCITKLCKALPQTNYADLNRIMGVLECAKLEFYRRRVSPYEDSKIQENGDV